MKRLSNANGRLLIKGFGISTVNPGSRDHAARGCRHPAQGGCWSSLRGSPGDWHGSILGLMSTSSRSRGPAPPKPQTTHPSSFSHGGRIDCFRGLLKVEDGTSSTVQVYGCEEPGSSHRPIAIATWTTMWAVTLFLHQNDMCFPVFASLMRKFRSWLQARSFVTDPQWFLYNWDLHSEHCFQSNSPWCCGSGVI